MLKFCTQEGGRNLDCTLPPFPSVPPWRLTRGRGSCWAVCKGRALVVRTQGPPQSSFGCWVTNAMPLSQIHLVPFTKKLGCVVHPLSTICSSFCLVGPVGIGLLKH